MKVAIHSVDGMNYPNLALMRISAYHKSIGDEVEWFMPMFKYDRVYASKIITDEMGCNEIFMQHQ